MSLDTPFLISKTPEICLKIDSQVTQLGLPVLRLGLPLTRSLTAIWLTGILIGLPGFPIELTGLQIKQTASFGLAESENRLAKSVGKSFIAQFENFTFNFSILKESVSRLKDLDSILKHRIFFNSLLRRGLQLN